MAASDFFGIENVPTQALTMGMATILESRKILLLSFGEGKAPIIRETVECPVSDRVPASFLQEHDDATALIDAASAICHIWAHDTGPRYLPRSARRAADALPPLP